MTAQDGTYVCDRCGGSAGNGGVAEALVVSDLAEDGRVVNFHFCRTPKGGCAKKVLSKGNLAHYGEHVSRVPKDEETEA